MIRTVIRREFGLLGSSAVLDHLCTQRPGFVNESSRTKIKRYMRRERVGHLFCEDDCLSTNVEFLGMKELQKTISNVRLAAWATALEITMRIKGVEEYKASLSEGLREKLLSSKEIEALLDATTDGVYGTGGLEMLDICIRGPPALITQKRFPSDSEDEADLSLVNGNVCFLPWHMLDLVTLFLGYKDLSFPSESGIPLGLSAVRSQRRSHVYDLSIAAQIPRERRDAALRLCGLPRWLGHTKMNGIWNSRQSIVPRDWEFFEYSIRARPSSEFASVGFNSILPGIEERLELLTLDDMKTRDVWEERPPRVRIGEDTELVIASGADGSMMLVKRKDLWLLLWSAGGESDRYKKFVQELPTFARLCS